MTAAPRIIDKYDAYLINSYMAYAHSHSSAGTLNDWAATVTTTIKPHRVIRTLARAIGDIIQDTNYEPALTLDSKDLAVAARQAFASAKAIFNTSLAEVEEAYADVQQTVPIFIEELKANPELASPAYKRSSAQTTPSRVVSSSSGNLGFDVLEWLHSL